MRRQSGELHGLWFRWLRWVVVVVVEVCVSGGGRIFSGVLCMCNGKG